ncbi:MAG: hypothetical protein Q7R47_01285 [Candidatus Diapherotrites archaeon]|nr:hypothetical protein [Candidatus Diapherotrites archaeon]
MRISWRSKPSKTSAFHSVARAFRRLPAGWQLPDPVSDAALLKQLSFIKGMGPKNIALAQQAAKDPATRAHIVYLVGLYHVHGHPVVDRRLIVGHLREILNRRGGLEGTDPVSRPRMTPKQKNALVILRRLRVARTHELERVGEAVGLSRETVRQLWKWVLAQRAEKNTRKKG